MNLPVVYVCCANSPTQVHLPALSREMQRIRQIFIKPNRNGQLLFDSPGHDTSPEVLFDNLNLYGSDLVLFHFSGHAGEAELFLSDGKFEKGHFLQLLSGLTPKVVVLNGCCTLGHVDALLNSTRASVSAVIATNSKVRDIDAAEFSAAFYGALLGGRRLQSAFEGALGAVRVTATASDAEAWGGLDTGQGPDDEAPWRLFYRKTDPGILNWVFPVGGVVPTSEEETRLQTELLAVVEEKKAIADQLRVFDFFPAGTVLPADLQAQKAALALNLQLRTDREAGLRRSLEALRARQRREAEAPQVLSRLREIDHFPQLQELEQLRPQLSGAAAFLLAGTDWCGLDILQNRVLHRLGIFGKEHKLMAVECGKSGTQSPVLGLDDLWGLVRQADPSLLPGSDLFDELYDRFFASQHLVLILKNLPGLPTEPTLDLLEAAWQTCRDALQSRAAANPAHPASNRLVLLVTDEVPVGTDSESLVSSRSDRYRNRFQAAGQFHPLSGVQPLSRADLETWGKRSDFFAPVKYQEFDKHRNYLLPTILKFCVDTQQTELFEKNFPSRKLLSAQRP